MAVLLLAGCGSRTGLDSFALDTEADAAPPSECAGSPDKPQMIATVGDVASFERVTALTVAQGYVYYEVSNGSNLGLFRVPISGGTPSQVVQGTTGCDVTSQFAFGNLATDGRYVFGLDEEDVGCTGYPVHVSAYDTTNGTLLELPIPSGADAQPRAVAPQALDGGGAVWVIDPGTYTGPVVMARWTGGSTSTVVATLPEWATGFVLAAGVGFVSTIANGVVTLYSVSLANGTVTPLGTFGVDFALMGANDEAIFYTPDGSTVSRREIASGAVESLSVPLPAHATWFDHDFFYFDSSEVHPPTFPAILSRIPAKGGTAKEIYRDNARDGVDAVTGDACNVYWIAGRDYSAPRPPALFVRKR